MNDEASVTGQPAAMSGVLDPGPTPLAADDPDFAEDPDTPPLTLVHGDAGAPPTDSLEDVTERAVLTAILEGHAVPAAVAGLLDVGMFHLTRHQVLYAVLCEMASRGVPIDEVTLLAQLDGQLDEAGGPEYISTLIGAVGNAATLPHYAALVRERALRRWTAEAARDLQRLADDPSVPQVQVAIAAGRAEELLRALRECGTAQTNFDPPLLAAFMSERRFSHPSGACKSLRGNAAPRLFPPSFPLGEHQPSTR